MGNLLRNLLALVGGAIVAGLCMAVIEAVGAVVYPPPPGFDPENPQVMQHYLAQLPPAAFLFVLAAYLVGTFGGVYLATRFSIRRPSRQGYALGAVLLLAGMVNFVRYAHPLWFVVTAVVVFVAATWAGVRFGRPRLTQQ